MLFRQENELQIAKKFDKVKAMEALAGLQKKVEEKKLELEKLKDSNNKYEEKLYADVDGRRIQDEYNEITQRLKEEGNADKKRWEEEIKVCRRTLEAAFTPLKGAVFNCRS